MGASGWDVRVPWQGSEVASFAAAQESVLASGDYLWPWSGDDEADSFFADEDAVPRPDTLAALTAARDTSDIWEGGGTHTILDLTGVASPGERPDPMITPLHEAELIATFGSTTPDADDLDRSRNSGALDDLLGPRWSGRCVTIWSEGHQSEVFFWGWSGD